MSLETRSNSALYKRAEQLKRWEDSDTNREPVSPKTKSRKIKFSSGCVFLAACAAGEKEEVLKLLEKGADIDTANVDGLTALHQACIDDNLDMVEFLVEHGADVNRGDNEGWTPLHATASCGLLSIAKYLIEHSANVAAVNCDGELALDIAESEEMEQLLQEEIVKQGIDCSQARSEEERLMLRDAKEWFSTKSLLVDVGNAKTGATALHVASAKGYVDVMKILLQCGADVDKQDIDGWTPLHAAAHWGQEETAKILVDHLADMDSKNFVGQTPFDLADSEMYKYLIELKTRQNKEEVNKRQAKKRQEVQNRTMESETPPKVKRVEVEIENKEDKVNDTIGMEVSSESETVSSSTSSDESSSEAESEHDKDEKKNRVNSMTNQTNEVVVTDKDTTENNKGPPTAPPKQISDANIEENTPSWRRPNSRPPAKVEPPKLSSNSFRNKNNAIDTTNENEVQLRRTNSFQNDPAFYERYLQLRARIQAASYPPPNPNSKTNIPASLPNSNYIIPPSNNLHRQYRNTQDNLETTSVSSSTTTTPTVTSSPTKTTCPATSPLPNSQPVRSGLKLAIGAQQMEPPTSTPQNTAITPTTPVSPGGTRLTMIKNFFKSFVPPVRDEESETQRKAHAKRVRETRRSTQGVTLEEIKSAEQLVKKKNQTVNNNNNEQSSGANGDPSNGVCVTATITTGTPTVITRETSAAAEEPTISHERRPSWRLRVDNGSKFKLEDVNKVAEPPSTPSFIRRPSGVSNNTTARPSSAPVETAETTVTLPLRRPKSIEEKEQDKENDARNAQATLATQAAIQRRRRPKRRSTGVVAFDNLDDMEQEKDSSQGGGGDCEDTKLNHQEDV